MSARHRLPGFGNHARILAAEYDIIRDAQRLSAPAAAASPVCFQAYLALQSGPTPVPRLSSAQGCLG